jgi:hypothetical protein
MQHYNKLTETGYVELYKYQDPTGKRKHNIAQNILSVTRILQG